MKHYAYVILANNEIFSWGMSLDNPYYPNKLVDLLPFAKNASIAVKNFCTTDSKSKIALKFYDDTKIKIDVVRYRVSNMSEFANKIKHLKYVNNFKGKKIEDLI